MGSSPGDAPVVINAQRSRTPSPAQSSQVLPASGPPVAAYTDQIPAGSDLPPGIFLSESASFAPPAISRVLNEAIAKLEFLQKSSASSPEGWCLVSSPYTFDATYFHHRTVGDLTVISPTSKGSASPHFLALFNSFREFMESETEKSRRHRELTYNQVLSLFHNDKEGSLRAKLGWDKGPKNKQVLATKVPPAVIDFMKKKDSPPRRAVKPALYFVGKEGTSEAAFLKTINSKHATKIDPEASVFRGELWDPKKHSEDSLDQSRIRLQRAANLSMCSQAIVDMGDLSTASALSKPAPELRDIIQKMSALALENVRLLEPTLISCLNDYAYKKKEVRSQMTKGLRPARVSEPLMQAPVFSEDLNVFPVSVQKSANDLALTVEDGKLVLPKSVFRARSGFRPPHASKRTLQDKPRSSFSKRQKFSSDRPSVSQPPAPRSHRGRGDGSNFRGNSRGSFSSKPTARNSSAPSASKPSASTTRKYPHKGTKPPPKH